MKNLLSIFALFVLLISIQSCKKNDEPAVVKTTMNVAYSGEAMALWRKLSSFNHKIKDGLKSDEFITPDSAMWYLEALFNVQYGEDTTYNDINTYKRSYSLTVNANGTVNMSDVIGTYNQMVTDLNTALGEINSEYKFLVIADLEPALLKNGGFTIDLNAGLGFNPLSLYKPITTDDNWRYGNMLGRCTNTQWDSDAGNELKKRFNNPYVTYPVNTGWINVEVSGILSYINFPGRIYHEHATSAPCIEYDELQYYLTQGYYILYNTATENPSGVRPQNLYYKAMDLWTNNQNPPDNEYWHKYQVWYGTPYQLPEID